MPVRESASAASGEPRPREYPNAGSPRSMRCLAVLIMPISSLTHVAAATSLAGVAGKRWLSVDRRGPNALVCYGTMGRERITMGTLDERIRAALETDRAIDITTIGRKSGQPRRIEMAFHNLDGQIYITGTPGKRDW